MTKTNADCLRLLPDRLSQLAADRLDPAQNTPQVSRSYLRDIVLVKAGPHELGEEMRKPADVFEPFGRDATEIVRAHDGSASPVASGRSSKPGFTDLRAFRDARCFQASSQTWSLSSSKTRVGSASAIPQARWFARVAARTLARSPIRDQLHRRLQPFRHVHDCSGCFRLERSPGGACTHWKAPPWHGAHVRQTLRIATVDATGRVSCQMN